MDRWLGKLDLRNIFVVNSEGIDRSKKDAMVPSVSVKLHNVTQHMGHLIMIFLDALAYLVLMIVTH